MLRKDEGSAPQLCRVTFEIGLETGARQVHLCGDFNNWSTSSHGMQRDNGHFSITLELERGRRYRYRYFVDGERWENDWAADDYEANIYGGQDSVVVV